MTSQMNSAAQEKKCSTPASMQEIRLLVTEMNDFEYPGISIIATLFNFLYYWDFDAKNRLNDFSR